MNNKLLHHLDHLNAVTFSRRKNTTIKIKIYVCENQRYYIDLYYGCE